MKKEVMVPLELCNLWNCFFLEIGGQHPNVSTGMAAAIIALDRWQPDTLYLAGFDKVLAPWTDGYQCTVPTAFNNGGKSDTGHDWSTEHRMLAYLCAHFNVRILDLADVGREAPPTVKLQNEAAPCLQ